MNGKKVKRKGVWDESVVEEYTTLRDRMNKLGIIIHLGRVFDLCVEKKGMSYR